LKITGTIWLDDVVDKLCWKQQVTTMEVEELLSGKPKIAFKEKGKRDLDENLYVALGTTEAGRYLIVLFILKSHQRALVLSARDMTISEKNIMKKSIPKLPTFNSLKEIEEFWDSHEFTEFQGDFKEIEDIDVNIKDRTYLPITLSMYDKLEKIASEKNTTVDRLIQSWVQEKMTEFEMA
jgi:uncharacterized DUF497 family protein